jgi:hypothetical protein
MQTHRVRKIEINLQLTLIVNDDMDILRAVLNGRDIGHDGALLDRLNEFYSLRQIIDQSADNPFINVTRDDIAKWQAYERYVDRCKLVREIPKDFEVWSSEPPEALLPGLL